MKSEDAKYDEIDDETKLSVVVGIALREGDQVIPETFNPVALTKFERLIEGKGVASVHINPQPPSAYRAMPNISGLWLTIWKKKRRKRNERVPTCSRPSLRRTNVLFRQVRQPCALR
ncbi:MAG: hypothetical protein I3I97_02995 [Bifidobacterium thermophilum]|nr:hypothetical protein [Bifidobacterium thermophilum]